MPFPTATAQVNNVLLLSGDPEPMLVTYGLHFSGAPDQATVDGLFDAFSSTLLPQLSSDYSLQKVEAFNDTVMLESSQSPVNGSSGDEPAPSNTAYLIRKNSGLLGRQNRGRFYLPGVSKDNVDSTGRLNSGLVSDVGGAVSDFFDAIVAVDPVDNVVILHGDTSTPTPVTSFVLQPVVATQRRRLRP